MAQDIKVETWKKRIQEAESHPVSVSAYCKEKNIPRSTLASWQQRLKGPVLGRSNPAKIGSFIQVDIAREKPKLPDPKWVAEVILFLSQGVGA